MLIARMYTQILTHVYGPNVCHPWHLHQQIISLDNEKSVTSHFTYWRVQIQTCVNSCRISRCRASFCVTDVVEVAPATQRLIASLTSTSFSSRDSISISIDFHDPSPPTSPEYSTWNSCDWKSKTTKAKSLQWKQLTGGWFPTEWKQSYNLGWVCKLTYDAVRILHWTWGA